MDHHRRPHRKDRFLRAPFILAATRIAIGPLALWFIVGDLAAVDHAPQ